MKMPECKYRTDKGMCWPAEDEHGEVSCYRHYLTCPNYQPKWDKENKTSLQDKVLQERHS